MATPAGRLGAFTPLRGRHPLAAELEGLLERVAADPVLDAGAAPSGAPAAVRHEVRAAPAPGGGAGTVERFLWCVQWREPGVPGGLRARTLLYERGRGEPRSFDFPDDPWLEAAAAPDSPLQVPDIAVLRYIPTRRITFRADGVVGKIKRPKSLPRAYARVEATFAAARGAGIAVPEPRGLDAARGAFYQQLMPGRPVDELIDPGNAERLLRALGAVHRAVHELPVHGVPERDPGEAAEAVREDAGWVAFAVPDHAGALATVERWLVSELASPGGERRYCHGDPALDQVLLEGDTFAVVDFDDAAFDDPHADLGTTLAALPFDAPQLFGGPGASPERVAAAYLDGYCERSGAPLDERRLRAQRARAELTLLARRLHKGLAGADEVAHSVARLRAAAARGGPAGAGLAR